jgi:hypothetical protein
MCGAEQQRQQQQQRDDAGSIASFPSNDPSGGGRAEDTIIVYVLQHIHALQQHRIDGHVAVRYVRGRMGRDTCDESGAIPWK